MTSDYVRLGALPAKDLEQLLVRGETPEPERLAGWEYRGLNTPGFAKLLGIKKFVKGFYKGARGQLFGYNMPVVQNAIAEPWVDKRPEEPKRFGFYRVDAVDAAAKDNAYLHALLLDYGRAGGSFFAGLDPTTRLRDYLVRVEPGSDDLLIGKAFVAVGPARVPVSYFLLERLRPTEFRR